jgi:regulator of protease activity HflC (stomatin/prohibitin superfamily)
MHVLVPFVDKVRANIDLREQVVTFPPQPVITSDNLVVSIDTVIYYTVTDAKSAVYEIANFIQGIEQLTVTTLRNVIGSLDLEQTLTSARPDQRAVAWGPGPGDWPLGHPGQPRRAQGHRPAALRAGLDGEADARRA